MSDTNKLIEIFTDSEAGKAIGSYIKKRERNRGDTNIARVASELGISYTEAVKVLKRLQDEGVGQVTEAKAGKHKFKWDVSPVAVRKQVWPDRREINATINKGYKVYIGREHYVEVPSIEDAVAILDKFK